MMRKAIYECSNLEIKLSECGLERISGVEMDAISTICN